MENPKKAECLDKVEILHLQELLKAVGDANRLRMICLLFEGEKCVCDIEEKLGISQPLASHHLAVLREAGLVKVQRKGTWAYYSLRREGVEKLNNLFVQLLGLQRFPSDYQQREECEEALEEGSC
ncbi:MAG: ArsR/SmtB family transcription factor [Actinomycetota bacterium]